MTTEHSLSSVNHVCTVGETFLEPVRWDVGCSCGFEVANLSSREAADDTIAWHLSRPSQLGGGRVLDTMVPVAILTLDGQGNPLITDISTPEGWRTVWDVMALDATDAYTSVADIADGWSIEITTWPRSKYEALDEHGGW